MCSWKFVEVYFHFFLFSPWNKKEIHQLVMKVVEKVGVERILVIRKQMRNKMSFKKMGM